MDELFHQSLVVQAKECRWFLNRLANQKHIPSDCFQYRLYYFQVGFQ